MPARAGPGAARALRHSHSARTDAAIASESVPAAGPDRREADQEETRRVLICVDRTISQKLLQQETQLDEITRRSVFRCFGLHGCFCAREFVRGPLQFFPTPLTVFEALSTRLSNQVEHAEARVARAILSTGLEAGASAIDLRFSKCALHLSGFNCRRAS